MADKFMELVQEMVARAIEKQADKEIEAQKKRFEEEIEQYKGELVGRMVNAFRTVRKYSPDEKSVTIKIVLKEANDGQHS